ncbi:arylsulfatase [Flexithrix dorotheae]|uniref:arylsulfatase n=1 Tax=Flexithrix dorotheae TaxID=70993 RepID=UPI0003751E82|nr:arylsulfatase [Flexithrix dorotheae]
MASCQPKQKQQIVEDSTKDARPNIIVILADDMGYSDLGCFGSEIQTPNLDRLAENGMRMTKFYNAARCCPSRASLLTGKYPHLAGIGSMTQDFGRPGYEEAIREDAPTIAQVLQPEGYNTYHVGKWHVGSEEKYWPKHKGFQKDFTFVNGASSYYNLKPYTKTQDSLHLKLTLNGELYRPGKDFYMTDAFSDYAVQFIEEDDEKPFFMYLAYTAPHWPLHALPEDIARYKGKYSMGWDSLRVQRYEKMKAMGIISDDTPLSMRSEDLPAWKDILEEEREGFETLMALYAAVIDRMDQGIGRVIKALEEKGELDNTLIVFVSDNGGSPERMRKVIYPTDGELGSERSFPTYGAHWANVSNTPFRYYKAWVQEGGIATPFIAHWPKQIAKGGLNNNYLGHIMDILPTSLDIAGVEYPKELNGKSIPEATGKSFLPALKGEPVSGHDALFWEHEGVRAMREGDWKLVSNKYYIDETGWNAQIEWQLFNLKEDPSEMNNVIEQQEALAKNMIAKYEAWAEANWVVSPQEFFDMKAAWKKERGLAPAGKF